MDRRKFIILTGIGATSAGMLSACGHPEEKLIPALIPDEEYVPGIDYWKASACSMCEAGCGIIVRTREHRANKIEGNPLHPINRGALCAKGQAGLQILYNPDRIRGPMKRTGERGSGQFEEITWDEAIKTLVDKLREIRSNNLDNGVAFATRDSSGVTWLAAMFFELAFTKSSQKMTLIAESLNSEFDFPNRLVTPVFDIANATYLLSFGARFLETWHSPVRYSLAYGEFRNSRGKARGRFVQVEPRMSMTAANADEWMPAKPGTEGLVALAIAQVIIREGLRKDAVTTSFKGESIDVYAPEKTADRTDVAPERIIRIAREFAAADRPLAISSGVARAFEQNSGNVPAINFLNQIVGNMNKPGGVLMPAAYDFDPLEKIGGRSRVASRVDQLRSDGFSALLVHQSNPVYMSPRTADQIRKLSFIASFSSFMDETTALADLILPDHTYLESWDIRAVPVDEKRMAVTVNRPVIKPELNTRQTADVLIAVGRQLGETSPPFSFESSEEIVKKALEQLPVQGEASEDAVDSIIENGMWVGEAMGEPRPPALTTKIFLGASVNNVPNDSDYPLTLFTYEHAMLGTGEQANLPRLQEMPDSMTSVMWGSWVEINPKTAASLGINDGDLVDISSPHGTVRVAAVLYPAIRPDVIAVPYGQGHAAFGRYARNRGVNVIELNPLPTLMNRGVISDRSDIVQVKVTKVASGSDLIRFGTMLPEHIHIKR